MYLLCGVLLSAATLNISYTSDVNGADRQSTTIQQEEAGIQKLLLKYPGDPDLLIKLAKIKDKYGHYMEAVDLLWQARNVSPDYEDVYLLEAMMLNKLNNEYACEYKKNLNKDYQRINKKSKSEKFNQYLDEIDLHRFDSEIGTGYDHLSNNRGSWNSHYILTKYTDCSNISYYGGYEKIKRYEINDEEYMAGIAIPFDKFSYALEYRASSQHIFLPITTYYGLIRYGIGNNTGVQIVYTYRDYIEIESKSTGIGVDYYFSDYQVIFSREWIHSNSTDKEFEVATVDKLGFTYYITKYKYLGLHVSKGTELNYDQSNNHPYSRTNTIVLKGLYPLQRDWAISFDLKRHQQIGYFNQSGVRLGVRYRY